MQQETTASMGADQALTSPGETAAESLDIAHLSRMTDGDRRLERELLRLFECQSAMLVERMRAGPETVLISCAHTLKGSARGIGAWQLAAAAERVEMLSDTEPSGCQSALEQLVKAVEAAHRAIAKRLKLSLTS